MKLKRDDLFNESSIFSGNHTNIDSTGNRILEM